MYCHTFTKTENDLRHTKLWLGKVMRIVVRDRTTFQLALTTESDTYIITFQVPKCLCSTAYYKYGVWESANRYQCRDFQWNL